MAVSADSVVGKYLARARAESGNGSIDHIEGRGQAALEKIRAATLLAGDTDASSHDRLKATEYLTGAVKAMEGYGLDTKAIDRARPIGDPSSPERPHLPATATNTKSINPGRTSNSPSRNVHKTNEPAQPPKISSAPGASDIDREVSSGMTDNTPSRPRPR